MWYNYNPIFFSSNKLILPPQAIMKLLTCLEVLFKSYFFHPAWKTLLQLTTGVLHFSNIHFHSCNICPDIFNESCPKLHVSGNETAEIPAVLSKFRTWNSAPGVWVEYSNHCLLNPMLLRLLVWTAQLCVPFPWAYPWARTCPLSSRFKSISFSQERTLILFSSFWLVF